MRLFLRFHQFSEELSDFTLGRGQCASSEWCCAVDLPERLAVADFRNGKVPNSLHPVKHRIKTAGADAVSMARKLLDHTEPEYWAFHCVMQDVQPDQAGVQLTIVGACLNWLFHARHRRRLYTSWFNLSVWVPSPSKTIWVRDSWK